MINTSMIQSLGKIAKAEVVLNKTYSSSKRDVFYFRVKDRDVARTKVAKQLKKLLIPYTQEITSLSGEELISLEKGQLSEKKTMIVFKPLSGGMTETTLNSTITELLPCLAFLNKIKTRNREKFYKDCTNARIKTCYVKSAEIKVGDAFMTQMPDSSKFKEKLDNAIAITQYLEAMHKQKSIDNVFWSYRTKPAGVDADSPADIVVKFTDGELLGISLKAGDATSKEPLLNSYVNPIMDVLASERDKTTLRNFLFEQVYSKIPGIQPTYDTRKYKKATRDILYDFETNNRARYEQYYDAMLEIGRQNIMEVFTNDVDDFCQYISKKVLKVTSTPTKIVKAIGKTTKEIEDSNLLGTLMPLTKSIEAEASKTSKQQFMIHLMDKNKTRIGTMNMSIRSNQVGKDHKLGQFYNLAVKYNGLD